jgi:hypothetical protein
MTSSNFVGCTTGTPEPSDVEAIQSALNGPGVIFVEESHGEIEEVSDEHSLLW